MCVFRVGRNALSSPDSYVQNELARTRFGHSHKYDMTGAACEKPPRSGLLVESCREEQTPQSSALLARRQRRATRHIGRVGRQEVADAGDERVPHVILHEDGAAIRLGIVGAAILVNL